MEAEGRNLAGTDVVLGDLDRVEDRRPGAAELAHGQLGVARHRDRIDVARSGTKRRRRVGYI